MRKNTENHEKLHKKSRMHMYFAGVSLLTLVLIGMITMLPGRSMESLALGGVVTGSASDNDDFWYGISAPRDLVISQRITVQDSATGLSTELSANTTDKSVNLNISFQRSMEFKPSIEAQVNNSHTGTGAGNLWQDYPYNSKYFSSVSCYSKGAVTFYRVDSNSTMNMGDILLNYYNATYDITKNYTHSDRMMITKQENFGRILLPVAENCAKENGWIQYTGNGIPMWQNGQKVKKIEMITVNPIDYYFSVYNSDGTNYKYYDLDLLLYSTHTYSFDYRNSEVALAIPVVTTESGADIVNGESISEDDVIFLSQSSNPAGTGKSQYYFSDTRVSDTSKIIWQDYNTSYLNLNGNKFLYVRSFYTDGTGPYLESGVQEYELHYMGSSSAIARSTPESGMNVDVGNEIELSQTGAAEGSALFYVIDADEAPTLSKVSYDDRKNLHLDNESADGKYVMLNGSMYIKLNGLWYLCSDSHVKKYDKPVKSTENLRLTNTMVIYVLVEDEGKESGGFQPLRYAYGATEQTPAPKPTVETSSTEPAVVRMGSTIGLICDKVGSKIFYTTNGSAPVIKQTSEGPVAGANTIEFDAASPIVVNDQIANYGETFLVMAQAVNYIEHDGVYYRASQDSPVEKFIYKVEAQAAVLPVQSVPKTKTETPAEVQIGSKIQLYSDTGNVDIYYTLDGSEPMFDEITKEPKGNTKKYDGATGVAVEKSTDSSLLIVTAVAYKEGLAASDISRLVFAYPGAVSSPYANPEAGAVTENTVVTLKTATEGAVIYYETAYGDKVPENPTISSKVFDETNPIIITQKTTIKALAVKDSVESAMTTVTYTVSDKLKIPTPSIETGAVVAPGTVINLNADSGSTIHYTLDGSDPKDAKNKMVQVGDHVVLNGDPASMIVLRAYASKSGFSDSEIGTYSYSISTYAGGIYADRESGEIVRNGETIYLHTDMSDATIYYTTDGSAPTENSHKGNQVIIQGEPGEQVTVMAMAIAEGSEKTTSFATFTYIIMEKLSAPTSSVPDGAIFTKEGLVELKAAEGRIYYTTDGSEPGSSSNLYKKSILIDKELTIKAIAVSDDLEQSEVSTFSYGFAEQVAAPVANYTSGELEMGTKVTFECKTEGATIYYRTDGGELNLSKRNELEIYTEPITVNKATNFKVIAVKDKMQDSKVLSVGYTVREPIVIETVEEEVSKNIENQSNRLQSRRSFSDTNSGPSYKDVVLRNASYGAVVAAEEESLPEHVQLKVEAANVTDAVDRRVKQVISENFGVVASYDVTLLVNGEEVQPKNTIEIGLPIPVEYENAMIRIIHVQEDGNIELFETRRSGGMAYAKVDHLSVFSIAAPVEYAEEEAAFSWLPVMYTLAVGLTGVGILLIYKSKKQRREDGMQDV